MWTIICKTRSGAITKETHYSDNTPIPQRDVQPIINTGRRKLNCTILGVYTNRRLINWEEDDGA